LNLAEINLYNARIRAPYPGVVTERLTEAGAYVQVGAPLIRMIGDRTLEVEAEVPFQHLAGIQPGIEMPLWLDDGTEHSAVVRAMLPSENPLTRTRAVRFIPNIGTTLRPLAHEQSVTLQVPIGPERQVLTVHKDAIVNRKGKDIVFVAKGDEVQARPVRLGTAVGGRMEVLDGLSEGEKVVVRGNERLRPGAKIQIVGES
jgi:RND family efflux transporter MFP subunit